MDLDFVSLLPLQRSLHELPRGRARFDLYIRTMLNTGRDDLELVPLVMANPMAGDLVRDKLDALLKIDAEAIARFALAEALPLVADVEGLHRVGLVVVDDAHGGWTNRFATEYGLRFAPGATLRGGWIAGVLWSSEEPSADRTRECIRMAIHRAAYIARHGEARTLRQKLAQEGFAITAAGCAGPSLDEDDIEYTREVIAPCLDETDMRTAIECLFGDAAARTLGFTPRGLSPNAGLALAHHDAIRAT